MPFKVSQGVTTLVADNCGVSLAPLVLDGQPPPPLDLLGYERGWFRFPRLADYVAALGDAPPAVNAGLLVGRITLRHRVMDRLDRAATLDETAAMVALVDQALAEGAIGFSTGLDYPDSIQSSFDEVLGLAARVRPAGGLCCCHHRNCFAGLEAALREVFALGEGIGAPVILSQHQCSGHGSFGKGPMTLEMIEAARRRGGASPSASSAIPTTPRPRRSTPAAWRPACGSW